MGASVILGLGRNEYSVALRPRKKFLSLSRKLSGGISPSQSRKVARIEVWSYGVAPSGARKTVPAFTYEEITMVGTRTPKRVKSNWPLRETGYGSGGVDFARGGM